MNQFFFIQNLSEWHFSCRKRYNKVWLEEASPLTKDETKALDNLKKTLKKHGFSLLKNKKAFNAPNYFLRYDELKNETDALPKSELQTYLKAMDVFKPRFEKIWESQYKNFKIIQTLLIQKFDQSDDQILKDLDTLFKGGDYMPETDVVLLLSTGEKSGGGGANNGPNVITIECSSLDKRYINYQLSVIWHEIAHNILRKYTKKLEKILDEDPIILAVSKKAREMNFSYIRELFIYSLFTTTSFLTNKYFPTESSLHLKKALAANQAEWFITSRNTFPTYLIYLNGLFMEEKLKNKESIPVKEMAKEIVKNHQLTNKYFHDHDGKVTWFSHN